MRASISAGEGVNSLHVGRWVKGSQAIRLYHRHPGGPLRVGQAGDRPTTGGLDLEELKAAAKQAACSVGEETSHTESGLSSGVSE